MLSRIKDTGLLPAEHKSFKQAKGSKWYAIYTRSRFEKKLYRALSSSSFEVFLPLIKEYRRWSDRVKLVSVPLLPSYVFVRMPEIQLYQLYDYPGVARVVSFEGKACEVKEAEIALMEKMVSHGFSVQSSTGCTAGDRVQVIRGPLLGWEGIVESTRGKSRVVFQIESIEQAISVEMELSDLEKI